MAAISASHLSVFLAFAAIFFAPSALATIYTVGDDAGWDTGVNYTVWAQNKTFYVGDQLLFKYQQGNHNVYKVNGTQFHNCTIPTGQNALSTGNDVISLNSTGRKWYICGKEGHCGKNQKLVITVMDMAPAHSPLPSASGVPPPPPPSTPSTPSTPSGATKAAVSGHFGVIVAAVFGILGMMMA